MVTKLCPVYSEYIGCLHGLPVNMRYDLQIPLKGNYFKKFKLWII